MFDVEAFIEAVKERPALYDSLHKNYNRKDVRVRLWDEIGQKTHPDWTNYDAREKNEKVSIMQKKWKSLKDCFNREIRLQRTRDPKKFRKKYEFYDRLTFLLHDNQTPAPTAPPTQPIIKLENPEPEIRAQGSSLRPPEGGNSRKRKSGQEQDIPSGKRLQSRREDETDDSDRLFLLSFVSDLKRLPFATKCWVRMMFSQIMHQAARSLEGCYELDHDQEVGSPGNEYLDDPSVTDNYHD